MNNYYTLFMLVSELRYKISGKKVTEVCSHRKDQIDLFFEPDHDGKLTFCVASPGTALFMDRRTGKPGQNKAFFFPEIIEKTVSDIALVSTTDRLVRMSFADASRELLFMPFSSRPNLFLVERGTILSSFKNQEDSRGKPAPEVREAEDVPKSGNTGEPPPPDLPLKKKILAIDPRFPRGLIQDVADICRLDDLEYPDFRLKIAELQGLLMQPKEISITAEGKLSLLPSRYLSHPPEQTFDSVNEAVRALFFMHNRALRLLPRKNDLVKKLHKRLVGLEKQQEQFDKAPERVQKADTYEHYGHLLMSLPECGNPAESDSVTMPDWADNGQDVVIPLKKGVRLIEQAQKYYDKSARIRRETAMSGKIKKRISGQKNDVVRLLEELESITHPPELEKWLKRHESRLQELGLQSSAVKQAAVRPYRLVTIGEHEIWIGKSAKSNDELLVRSHKEDIWMHVRGAAGSHVILRNRGNAGWPDSGLIRKAASFAAAFSRQAGSSLVPVMIAKRKHVRKPKGATPGQVVVTNERVEMVTPQKPDIPDF